MQGRISELSVKGQHETEPVKGSRKRRKVHKVEGMLPIAIRIKVGAPYLGSLAQRPSHKPRSQFDRSSLQVRISGETIARRQVILGCGDAAMRMGSGMKLRRPKVVGTGSKKHVMVSGPMRKVNRNTI